MDMDMDMEMGVDVDDDMDIVKFQKNIFVTAKFSSQFDFEKFRFHGIWQNFARFREILSKFREIQNLIGML